MNLQQALSEIKKLVGQGNIEQALEQLTALLDANPAYAELAQAARVNQADWYQTKSNVIKGLISTDDARIANSQVADNVLELARRLETGRLALEAPAARRTAPWRYVAAGIVVALAGAFIAWKVLKQKDECGDYGKPIVHRVMILPFKKTGEKKSFQPEFDISDGLNDLIAGTPSMKGKVEADVNENYDTETGYPNPSQVADIASNCDVQMVVWGKINQALGNNKDEYTLEVRYKLFGYGAAEISGDTVLTRMLATRGEGGWIEDARTVINLLYLVLANQTGTPVYASALGENWQADSQAAATTTAAAAIDTSTALELAQNYAISRQPDKALRQYDEVLKAYPAQPTALRNRAAVLYSKGEYEAAVVDFEAAAPDLESADAQLLRSRVEANLKSEQPEKAMNDLEQLSRVKGAPADWIKAKYQEAINLKTVLQIRLKEIEAKSRLKPANADLQLEAAKTRLHLGDTDKAIKQARTARQTDPKNADSYAIELEAHIAKGDTSAAVKILEKAEESGVNVKSFRWRVERVAPLSLQKQ